MSDIFFDLDEPTCFNVFSAKASNFSWMWIVIYLCEDTWEISPDREVVHRLMFQLPPAR